MRASLVMPDLYQRFEESSSKQIQYWLELTDQYLYVNQIGFTHFANVFFSNALQKAVSAFTDTGVLQYLFECNFHLKRQHQHSKKICSNVLNLHDLSFGFYIWLAACCVSVLVFLVEFLMRMCMKDKIQDEHSVRRIKSSKVYPDFHDRDDKSAQKVTIKAETLHRFRVTRTLMVYEI